MDNERVSLNLNLELSGDALSGDVRRDSGPGRRFSGWLGLLGAIDAIVAEGDRSATEHETRGTVDGSRTATSTGRHRGDRAG